MNYDKLKKFDPETFFSESKPCAICKRIEREREVADLKEIYPRSYLIEHNLCTPEEYASIPASTTMRDALRRAQGIASIMHQVVGARTVY
jgi:hypothetical protein